MGIVIFGRYCIIAYYMGIEDISSERVYKILPVIFGDIRLSSLDPKDIISFSDLGVRKGSCQTDQGRKIPIFIVDSQKTLKKAEFTQLPNGVFCLFRESDGYNTLTGVIPDEVNISNCGVVYNNSHRLHWMSKKPTCASNHGDVVALGFPSLGPGKDILESSGMYLTILAIIMAPGLVGMRKPLRVDQTIGCLGLVKK